MILAELTFFDVWIQIREIGKIEKSVSSDRENCYRIFSFWGSEKINII